MNNLNNLKMKYDYQKNDKVIIFNKNQEYLEK